MYMYVSLLGDLGMHAVFEEVVLLIVLWHGLVLDLLSTDRK